MRVATGTRVDLDHPLAAVQIACFFHVDGGNDDRNTYWIDEDEFRVYESYL
ncbi:MAG: hypothetical protein U1A16_03215 [Patescibacteria group bacterium]|nr:hypothetical protein [Patescibacteria group bacterium]